VALPGGSGRILADAPGGGASSSDIASADMRWLLLIAAAAFLTRMALNPRFFHYGYYQAALAGGRHHGGHLSLHAGFAGHP
jgi:hypothetical protein